MTRLTTRNRAGNVEAEGSGYLASVSDLMSGLIFIFIITLVIFAISYQEVEQDLKEVEKDLTDTEEVRRNLVKEIEAQLREIDPSIRVEVDEDNGILRLPEEILFPLGSATLTTRGRAAVSSLSQVFSRVLPCYSGKRGSSAPELCSMRDRRGRLDAVFVEGHTDDLPLQPGARYANNWELSAARSITTYRALVDTETDPPLLSIDNSLEQPILSVSAYAFHRPVLDNVDEESRSHNRRIDIRFVMNPPKAAPPDLAKAFEDEVSKTPGGAAP